MVVRILAVDDEPDILGALADAWEQEELELVCAGSAEEALKVLGAAAFDVLLTDFKMPGGDGLDLIQQVTAQQPSVRCYLMTAFPDSALKDRAIRGGCKGFVPKPFDARLLLRKMRRD